jgi:hypothetical protein
MMVVVMVEPRFQKTVTMNKVDPPGIPLNQAYPTASREQMFVDVSPALNIRAFATALACCMLGFSVKALKNGIILIN